MALIDMNVIADLLLSIPSIGQERTRNRLLRGLKKTLIIKLPRSEDPQEDLHKLLSALAALSGPSSISEKHTPLATFLGNAQELLGESESARLGEFISVLAGETSEISNTERYIDYDLHVSPHGSVVASSLEGQAEAAISLRLPESIQEAIYAMEAGKTSDDLLKELGRGLYALIFNGAIHTHFHQTESVARRAKSKVRIRLRIEAEKIAALPLEFIYREMGGYYLATNPNTVLSRYLNVPLPERRVRHRDGPLQMLAIIADPVDQTRLPPVEWENILKSALAVPLSSGQMKLRVVERATRRAIQHELLEEKPDIIQFVGHGIFESGKGHLALVSEETGKTWPVDDEQFARLYLGFDDYLGLIVLATCESARSEDPQGFLGIAPKLVEKGVPAVVAMQYKVLIETAKIFLDSFYTAVAARKPIDWATQLARNAISLEFGTGNREFGTPVLYMRAKDGNVF